MTPMSLPLAACRAMVSGNNFELEHTDRNTKIFFRLLSLFFDAQELPRKSELYLFRLNQS